MNQYVPTGKVSVPNFSPAGWNPGPWFPVMHWAGSGFCSLGHLKFSDPEARARAIVKAATIYNDPAKLLKPSEDLGMAMQGLDVAKMAAGELMQTRGW